MLFNKKDLQDMVYDDSKVLEKIEETITGHTRWSVLYSCIFKYYDKYYTTGYSKGATEYQDEQPFEYASEKVRCNEVIQKEVLTKIWVLVR